MSKNDYCQQFLVKPGVSLKLEDIDPSSKGEHEDKSSAEKVLEHYAQRLMELQYLLYAEGKRSLLICLQALDAGGKDGTIRHVLSYMNPQGCRVQPFKQPSVEEAAHDFLWRAHKVAPMRGEVAIFNRSYYEDVLVVRVHNLVGKDIWHKRYEAINDFERHLTDSGTHIIKFFLHISPKEQLFRFKQRIDDPSRQWKISETDYSERGYWQEYLLAYEEALSRCSTHYAPWYVIPSDHKWFRNLAVSRIVVETLEALKMAIPEPRVDIDEIRRKFHQIAAEKG